MKPRILAVDDDQLILDAMALAFRDFGCPLDVAKSADAALEMIRRNPVSYSVVFIDHNLSKDSKVPKGNKLAKQIKDINPAVMVVMVSGDRSPDVLRSWLESGVDQFLLKPTESHELLFLAENAEEKFRATYGFSNLESPERIDPTTAEFLRKADMIGGSKATARVAEAAVRFASNNYNVLILGETGTGKEVVANAIHKNSVQSKKPFLPINCSGFRGNEHLLESELFGHEKGSFTGADKLKLGVFESAQGGVVFLDEIHHLSPSAQAKILRVVQHRKVRRVGGTVEIPVQFRLISAGKPELTQMGIDGPFTLDLYYRVKELLIEISPLRERREDIVPLLRYFKSVHEHELGRKVEFAEGTLQTLSSYDWPGNVREISGLLKELLVTTRGSVIRPEDLPENFRVPGASALNRKSFTMLVAEQEMQQRLMIEAALEQTGHNVTQASTVLQIPRSTMRDLLKKFGIRESRVRGNSMNKLDARQKSNRG